MFNHYTIKKMVVLVIFFFGCFTLSSSYTWGQNEEDELLQARRMYQQGDYEGSIQVLVNFIQKVKKIVEQKKNVAQASYLLAKIYYTVGEDRQAVESLKYVFTLYPGFQTEETDLQFKNLVDRIKEEIKSERIDENKSETQPETGITEPETPQPGVIEQPGIKKKKKFPVMLVVGGIALAAVVFLLLSKKSGEEEEQYDIRGTWELNYRFHSEGVWYNELIEFNGSRTSGSASWNGFNYTVDGRHVRCEGQWNEEGTQIHFVFDGQFQSPNTMSGSLTAEVRYPNGTQVTLNGEWNAQRVNPNTRAATATTLFETLRNLTSK